MFVCVSVANRRKECGLLPSGLEAYETYGLEAGSWILRLGERDGSDKTALKRIA